MENPKISIIVPVYNAEKYLRKCIDSIIAQTYKNYELILVDDGSTDSCPEICDEYKKIDSRIIVFHKINEGVSSARNLGLENARGSYITFIDSDDYVTPIYLEYLVQETTDDYVVSGYYLQNKNFTWDEHQQKSLKINMDEIKSLPDLINNVSTGMIWGRRYKTDIIRKNNLRFEIGMRRGEDVLFNINYLLFCTSITVLPKANYYYCFNASSATNVFEPQLFEWSMKSVLRTGEIIGTNSNIFLMRVWNNAMLVCDNYFMTAKGKNLRTQLRLIHCIFKVCKNKYVRKSLIIAKEKESIKKVLMIKFYIYPFLPYIYSIYKKLRH